MLIEIIKSIRKSLFRGEYPLKKPLFCNYLHSVCSDLDAQGRHRTSENYRATMRSFLNFRNGSDIPLDAVDSAVMTRYQAFLSGNGVALNSISFYMRILRAVYNRAVREGLIADAHPFRDVYTGICHTDKRGLRTDDIRRIHLLDLRHNAPLALARDLFMFSFYTRGMSFVDMAYLRKSDLADGELHYRRRKTGASMTIRWEKCMQQIVTRHSTKGIYLLPIIRNEECAERQYRNALRRINKQLKEIARLAGLTANLTMYVSRHSWASIARNSGVPLSIISAGMGHGSEKTTQIYLQQLDNRFIDDANAGILAKI